MLCHVECADTWENHDERNDELEETCKHETLLCLIDALGSETLLDDVLVEAPVTEVCEPYTTDYGSDTRYVSECACIVRLLDDEVEVGILGVFSCRESCVDILETLHCSTVTGSLESEPCCDETTTDKEEHLHNVCPCN